MPAIISGPAPQSPLLVRAIRVIRATLWSRAGYSLGAASAVLLLLIAGVYIMTIGHQSSPSKSPQPAPQMTPGAGAAGVKTASPSPSPTKPPASASPTPTKSPASGTAPSGAKGGTTSSSGSSSSGATGSTTTTGSSGTATCPAFPAIPDANCTGYAHTGVTLHACSTTLTGDNAVYDSCLFDGGAVIVGTNITIKRSKITGIVSANWDANGSLRGLKLQDVEIDGSPYFDPDGQAAIGLDNYTCTRCNVHNTGRGANFRNNVTIQDSYFHDFVYVSGAHQSGIGSNGGSNNAILHNNIVCNGVGGSGCSGALVMYGDFDPIDNILVQNNLFNTDGSYCTYAGSTGTSSGKAYPHGTNIRYLNNLFGKQYYSTCADNGPAAAWEYNAGNVWSGNAWQDGSGAINL